MIPGKIQNIIEDKIGSKIVSSGSISGGCISDAYKIKTENDGSFFLKINENTSGDMFVKEANGLIELEKADAIRVPKVFIKDEEFILLELIKSASRSKTFFEDFGIAFAKMHKYHGEFFGFYEDNYIGSNPQINIPADDEKNNWIKFYFNKRILYQYKLAEKNGYATDELKKGISKLENKVDKIIGGSEEKPSVLHGDLWGGNYMVDDNGDACLIDPAVYYGHREADLAMTKLFGNFGGTFYKAYNEEFPLPDGWEYRENIYKLYHVLNHLNLFGTGYYQHAISLIDSY